MYYSGTICICLAILLSGEINAQTDVRFYTSQDGLSANWVNTMYQDRFGYFWIGTMYGLNRFDGSQFKKYDIQHGLPSLQCLVLLEDSHDRFWIGTRNGIAEFKNDSFYLYQTSDSVELTYVSQLYEDHQGDLVANTAQGQYRFNSREWEPYRPVIPKQERGFVVHVITTHEGKFVSTGFELFFLQANGQLKKLWNCETDYPCIHGIREMDGRLYMDTNGGLFEIDSDGSEALFPEVFKHNELWNSFRDSQGNWWFSTYKEGIIMMQLIDGQYVKRPVHTANKFIAGFFEDRQQQVWIGSTDGLIKILPTPYTILDIKEIPDSSHILNIIPMGDHQFLLSVNDGRLLWVEHDTSQINSYQVKTVYHLDHPIDFVDHFTISDVGELWMITRFGFLYLLHNDILHNKTHLLKNAGQPWAFNATTHPLTGQLVIAVDSFLAIENEGQLDTFFDSEHKYIPFPRQAIFAGNRLIVRTLKGEIFMYDVVAHGESLFENLITSVNRRRKFKISHAKELWIYNEGESISVNQISHDGRLIEVDVIDKEHDNINMLFSDFTIDQHGSFWCVSQLGIQKIYKDERNAWQSRSMGLYEISRGSILEWFHLTETNDYIWVSLRNKLVYFNETITGHEGKPAGVILEDIQLHNKATDWKQYADSLESYFEIPVNLKLRHNQNTLTFFYNSPTTLESQEIMYAYRLLPVDTNWSKASENKSVSFVDLHPSQYTFQVRSRSTGKAWVEPTTFSFVIEKAFWETTWFRFIILASISGLVAAVFGYRLRQERAKGEMKNQLLELEMRALRTQMNPHFIYNALNSIQALVATNQTTAANKYISKFSKLLRQIFEYSKRSEIPLNQELTSLRLYVELEKLRLDEDVIFDEKVDGDVSTEHILIPPLTIQPFVENALWHGLSSRRGEKKIELTIQSTSEWIDFTITDNGIGRSGAAQKRSYTDQHTSSAMNITGQRLRAFNQDHALDAIEIIDLFNEDGTPAGTRVHFRIRRKFIGDLHKVKVD